MNVYSDIFIADPSVRPFLCHKWKRNTNGVYWRQWREIRREKWKMFCSLSNDDLFDLYSDELLETTTYCFPYQWADLRFITRILEQRLKKTGFLE